MEKSRYNKKKPTKGELFINTQTRNLKRYRKRVLSDDDAHWLWWEDFVLTDAYREQVVRKEKQKMAELERKKLKYRR